MKSSETSSSSSSSSSSYSLPNAPNTPSFCFPLNFGEEDFLEEEDVAGDIIPLSTEPPLDDPHNFGITCAPKKNTAFDNGNPIKIAANKSGCKRFQTDIETSFLLLLLPPRIVIVDLKTLGIVACDDAPPPQNPEP